MRISAAGATAESPFNRRSVWTGWFVLMFLLAIAAVAVVVPGRTVSGMGQAPGTCTNEYNGTITSLIINNGTKTFNVVSDPGAAIPVNEYSDYNLTLVIRMDNQSTAGNTNPGAVFYSQDAWDYEFGACGPIAGPGQSVTITGTYSDPLGAFTQGVTFGTIENNFEYNIDWLPIPSVPQNVSALGLTASQVRISWNPSSPGASSAPVTGYSIYRSTSPSANETLYASVGNVTSFTDTQVQSGTTYYYSIAAVNSNGEGRLSTQVKAVPPPAGKSWLVIETSDPLNDQTSGYGIVLSQNGVVVATQYSPANFTIDDGQNYTVTADKIDSFVFSRWGDEGTTQGNNPRTLTTSMSLILTAFYKDTNSPPSSSIPVPGSPWDIAVNPATDRIYVSNLKDGNVSVIDGSTETVVASIPIADNSCTASCPGSIAVNPTTNEVYVTRSDSGYETIVINGTTNAIIGTIAVSSSCSENLGCNSIGVDTATDRIYIANTGNNTVSVVNGSTNKVIATIPVGLEPSGIAVDEKTNTVYVADFSDSMISVIDGSTDSATGTIDLPPNSLPRLVAVNPNTNVLYVGNLGTNSITVVNGSSDAIIGNSTVATPYTLVVNPATNLVYTSGANSDIISVLGGPSFNLVFAYQVASTPQTVGIDPATNEIYFSNLPDSSLSQPAGVSVFSGSPASSPSNSTTSSSSSTASSATSSFSSTSASITTTDSISSSQSTASSASVSSSSTSQTSSFSTISNSSTSPSLSSTSSSSSTTTTSSPAPSTNMTSAMMTSTTNGISGRMLYALVLGTIAVVIAGSAAAALWVRRR